MPYITQNLRNIIQAHPDDAIQDLGDELMKLSHEEKVSVTHWACFVLLKSVYKTTGTLISPSSCIKDAQLFDTIELLAQSCALRIEQLHKNGNGGDGLLNYTLTRLFNQAFVAPRYKDYNDMIGILEDLKKYFTSIAAKGMLTCCQMEYYRKYAAPYEDLKESENGAVIRPDKISNTY